MLSASDSFELLFSALPSEHYAAFYRTRAAEIVESARVTAAEADSEADSDAPSDAEHVGGDDGRVA